MPVVIDGETYYRTAEACNLAGISKATLFRWLREDGQIDAKYRDRRGWRLFTEQEVEELRKHANQVLPAD